MKTFSISETKNADFKAKMEKFIKRAAKLGIEFGYDLVSTEQASYKVETAFGTWESVYYTVYNYNVYGESPTINGYSFLAKIEPLDAGVNLIHTHNSDYDFVAYRNSELICEHCNVNRRRIYYYLIINDETGDVKMVGRNCLAQYIEMPNAEDIAEFYSGLLGDLSLAEQQEEEKDIIESFRRGVAWLSVETIVAYAVYAVRNYGYTSKTAANENPMEKYATSSRVMDYIFVGKDYARDDEKVAMVGDETDEAKKIIAKVYAGLSGKNEYEFTIKALIENTMAKYNHIGYVCSMVAFYNRMIEGELKNAGKHQSNHIGEEGAKIFDLTATVTYTNILRNGFTTYLYNFDVDGNKVSYFSSNDLNLNAGDVVTISKATVKKHDLYRGEKQTIITRAKIA